jgi:hypothetical protein
MKMNKINIGSWLGIFAMSLFIVACGGAEKTEESEETAEMAAEEMSSEDDDWMVLFDGTSTEGWRGYGKDYLPSDWQVTDDGELYMAASGRGEAGSENGGDILYDKKFSNFHLSLEWKLSEGGNSGIFYLGQENDSLDFIWKTAPEMQILDNEKHIDANLGKDGNRQAGSLYDLYPAKPQNAKPAGEWNLAPVIVYNATVVHKQNGETVVEYHLWTPQWEEDVANSKFPELNPDWANVAKEGYIGLQDHGDDIWFRNIKIKEL